jgi:hypothetical protein
VCPRFLVPFPWLPGCPLRPAGPAILQCRGCRGLLTAAVAAAARREMPPPKTTRPTQEGTTTLSSQPSPAYRVGALADNDGMASSCKSGSRPIREVDRFSKQPPGRARFAAYIPPCPIHAPTSPVSCTCNLRSDTQTPSTIFTSSTKTCLGADFRLHPTKIQASRSPLRPLEMNHVVATCEMPHKNQDPRQACSLDGRQTTPKIGGSRTLN